jgi:hypothetical protein
MAQPYWNTSAGSLGIYPAEDLLYIQLSASSPFSATISYNLLNGKLPDGVTLDSTTGVIRGNPLSVVTQTTYTFTIRLIDGLGNVRDRTFSIDIFDRTGVKITTPPGTIIDTVDSLYINFPIQYVNPISATNLIFNITSGELPPGLSLSNEGVISGWPEPPVVLTTPTPTTTTYTFSISLTTDLARDTVTYSIVVRNHRLTNPSNTRRPAILNRKPLKLNENDPYLPYYLTSNSLPDAVSDDKYSFKIIGHDFDNAELIYQYEHLPPGLSGNPVTGWITGTPSVSPNTLSRYTFKVTVAKKDNTSFVSDVEEYTLLINNGVVRDIVWNTPTDLGSVDNGSISELVVSATSVNSLQYIVVAGKLPPNISLRTTGRLIGRIPFQPTTTLLKEGDSTTFTFTIRAFNPTSPLNSVDRTFTLTVNQTYGHPYETIYLKAYPDIPSKRILNSLLSSDTLIPPSYLHRPDDLNFNKASDVRVAHMFGVHSSSYEQYIAAMDKNHYTKRLVLGSLQKAVAKDSNNNIIYEVVYSPVFDDLSTSDGVSVPKSVFWKEDINLYDNDWITSNAVDNTSEDVIYTSFTPTIIRTVYPNSLVNMRAQMASVITQYTNQALLPTWMTSQQENGNTLGYMPVWVLCYVQPKILVDGVGYTYDEFAGMSLDRANYRSYAEQVIYNIENDWGYTLNEIDFQVDRYLIDKTATYNWNNNLINSTWVSLPSAFPPPSIQGAYDISVIFPQENILPNRYQINN